MMTEMIHDAISRHPRYSYWRQTMSELDAGYERGQETRRMFGGGTITSAGTASGAWEVAPHLERILGGAMDIANDVFVNG
jgi:hypothetical protein